MDREGVLDCQRGGRTGKDCKNARKGRRNHPSLKWKRTVIQRRKPRRGEKKQTSFRTSYHKQRGRLDIHVYVHQYDEEHKAK